VSFVALFVAGAIFGSFLNVVIYRMPRGRSVVRPPSACPSCGSRIRASDNVPILSYLILKGRCRECGVSIPVRYPVVELLGGALPVVLASRFGLVWDLALYIPFVYALLVVTFVDLDLRLIPDRITLPGLVAGLVLAPALGLTGIWESLGGALVGGAALYLIGIAGSAIFKQESMGGGDVKLAAMVGAVLGWGAMPVFLFASFLLGAIGGVVALASGRAGSDHTIPFGPFLAAGALTALLCGDAIARWYFSLFS